MWHEFVTDWKAARDRLMIRFPLIDPIHLRVPPPDRAMLQRLLAEAHDLTRFEAQEELEDFLQMEAIMRQPAGVGRR